MKIAHDDQSPRIGDAGYIAPNAVVRGDVSIGARSVVLFGAVITADGGPVEIGEDCVIMENTVIRGTPKAPVKIGNRVLVGPQTHLTGCVIDNDCFIATGSTVFNGARLEEAVEVRINGVVHINTRLESGAVVPIGWVAVGDPAKIYPASEHEKIWEIQSALDFPGTVFGVDRDVSKAERTKRYARYLAKHSADRIVD
jgi:carbonic anhydrase/acetyltransferase-like protein (isoleucine patch superfamily)